MATAIRFRDAVSLAGRFPLLAGVTCEVAEGEIVHLRGPNGAGKTSFLRACAGLVQIVSGQAIVLGYDLRLDRVDVRREVGLLGHHGALYDELSVEDNLRFAVRAARRPIEGIDSVCERLDVSLRLRGARVGQLSAGQRRRVALCAFIARAPRLWLLDEPHAGLDAAGRDVLDELMANAVRDGATVVFASHELDRARGITDVDLLMHGGRFVDEFPEDLGDGEAPLEAVTQDRIAPSQAGRGRDVA